MATLVFDIETVGEGWNTLDTTTQEVLARWADRTAKDEAEHAALLADIKEGLGFSPLTGEIVSIALYDVERSHGVVYYARDDDVLDEEVVGEYTLKPRSEQDMLAAFWEGAKAYTTFVTFNGRGFDVPFLSLRSVVHGIRPTHNLLQGRYLYQQRGVHHIDLLDQLTFYGAMHRRPSLHLFCRAFGIESPKREGISGDDVAELFRAKQFRDIARYNARDVIATTELYKKWATYLR